jgi:hypothetical protein
MTTVDIPAGFAPLPHALALSHPAPHVRLWSVLHYLGWNHTPFEASDLAVILDTTERSIYRWLDAMAEDAWLDFGRQPGSRKRSLGERITLYSFEERKALTSDTRITGCPQPLTPGSQVAPTSDRRITGCPQPLTPGSQTSDPTITGLTKTPRPNAAKNATQIRSQTPDSDPDPTTPKAPLPPTPSGGGGGTSSLSTATHRGAPTVYAESARLLTEAGVQSTSARTKAAALPPDQVRQVIALAAQRPRDKRPGWIARECVARVEASAMAPASPPPEVSHVRPARPRAPLPHELEARFRELEADARRAQAAGDAPE